ncbi:MAG: globin domain-containing protein, partial [Thermodesulfobacteriota bacterium]
MQLNIQLIQKSFKAIAPHADEVMEHFYKVLFSQHPEAKAFFENTNMKKQRHALAGGLAYIVNNWEKQEKLIPYLGSMGSRHLSYGVKDEYYDWVGAALLESLAYFLEDYWNEELKGEWTKLYTFVAEQMIKGETSENIITLTKSLPLGSNLAEYARTCAKKILQNVLTMEVNDNYHREARVKAKEILKEALDH